jgi:hypothetical protein
LHNKMATRGVACAPLQVIPRVAGRARALRLDALQGAYRPSLFGLHSPLSLTTPLFRVNNFGWGRNN